MNKHLEAENPQKVFILELPSSQIPYFPERLIPDKEELVFDKEREFSFLKEWRFFLKER